MLICWPRPDHRWAPVTFGGGEKLEGRHGDLGPLLIGVREGDRLRSLPSLSRETKCQWVETPSVTQR